LRSDNRARNQNPDIIRVEKYFRVSKFEKYEFGTVTHSFVLKDYFLINSCLKKSQQYNDLILEG